MPWQAGNAHVGFSAQKPWLPVSEAHRPLAVDAQEADANSTLHFTRRLLALRRQHPALRTGNWETLHAEGALLLLQRRHAGNCAWAAFNFGAQALTHEMPDPTAAALDVLAVGDARLIGQRLHLAPWSALIQVEAGA